MAMSVYEKSLRISFVVLFGLIVGGCGDKQGLGLEPQAVVSEKPPKIKCRFDQKYSPEHEECKELVFFAKKDTIVEQELALQRVEIPKIIRDSRVIDKVVAEKDGVGCIELTAKTKLPLTALDCEKLAKENGRDMVALVKFGLVVHVESPVIQKKEEWFLYTDEKGITKWKIPKGKNF
jgi:hypothetical protein